MSEKLKIGIDCDEPLADFGAHLCPWMNATYGTDYKKSDMFSYRLWDIWKCSKEEAVRRIEHFYKEDVENVPPAEGSVAAVDSLSKDHELLVITSRFNQAIPKTIPWINKHYPNKFSEIIFTKNTTADSKGKTKAQICKELGVDILIEDFLEYSLECNKLGIPVILFDCPWNQDTELPEGMNKLPSGIVRAKDWKEVLEKIEIFVKDKKKFFEL